MVGVLNGELPDRWWPRGSSLPPRDSRDPGPAVKIKAVLVLSSQVLEARLAAGGCWERFNGWDGFPSCPQAVQSVPLPRLPTLGHTPGRPEYAVCTDRQRY